MGYSEKTDGPFFLSQIKPPHDFFFFLMAKKDFFFFGLNEKEGPSMDSFTPRKERIGCGSITITLVQNLGYNIMHKVSSF